MNKLLVLFLCCVTLSSSWGGKAILECSELDFIPACSVGIRNDGSTELFYPVVTAVVTSEEGAPITKYVWRTRCLQPGEEDVQVIFLPRRPGGTIALVSVIVFANIDFSGPRDSAQRSALYPYGQFLPIIVMDGQPLHRTS